MERWELPNGRVKYYQGGNGRYINFVARTANYKLQRAYKKKPRKDLSDHNRLQNKVVPGHAYIKCCIVDCVHPENSREVIAYSGHFLIKDWLSGIDPMFRKVRGCSNDLVPRTFSTTKQLESAIDRSLRKRKPFTIYLH